MRAKQSSTAIGIFSCSGTLPVRIPIRGSAAIAPRDLVPRFVAIRNPSAIRGAKAIRGADVLGGSGVAQGEGLLHDARNLTGALRLYCDLLALPGVLKPEHAHYVDELRLLGTRSGALMERLALSLPDLEGETKTGRVAGPPVSLRVIVERCSGLLEQVAGGRTIELSYGPAASALVSAGQEDVERILVNLVRNAAGALDVRGGADGGAAVGRGRGTAREMVRDRTADQTADAIRIGVGLLQNRVGDAKPWPFRRVRLTVEDSGCGMGPEQVEGLLRSGRAPARGRRGIGFCVVRELIAGGGGDLQVMSAEGVGTRVQIEWPIATMSGEMQAGREGGWPIC